MSKDNMFLGKARGKVGDLVFYVQDGIQMTRTRNRHPRNRNTEPQQFQRAIMATVSQVYKVGSTIFDHAFQGYSVGAKCQRRFLSLNANMLRSGLASEANNSQLLPEESEYKVTGPGVATPVPDKWIISSGTYDQRVFTQSGYDNTLKYNLPAPTAGETQAEYAARVGLIAGDIYTFVFIGTVLDQVLFSVHGLYAIDVDQVKQGYFGWCRLIVKGNLSVSVEVSTSKIPDLFDIEFGGVANPALSNIAVSGDLNITAFYPDQDIADGYCIGLIRSRRDQDLRSDSVMTVCNVNTYGLFVGDIVEAWSRGTTQLGNSELILEGGGV